MCLQPGMPHAWVRMLICLAALSPPWTGQAAESSADDSHTPLDQYVAQPDPAFNWSLSKSVASQGYTTYFLEMTSQSWRTAADVDRPVWTHRLTMVRPDGIRPETPQSHTAFLFIGGGSHRDTPPTAASPRVVRLAVESGSVVGELGMVPNQPLTFTDSPDNERYEDDLIAYSRVRFMATSDPTWLVRLAMVKSGVRALDAMQQFLATPEGGALAIRQFAVAGGSKRGWTTWLVAAVDPRVVAIVPLVIDALNSQAITRHHYEAYGFFSPALDDYVRHGLFPQKIGTPEYAAVLAIEDPYHYRHRARLRIPKLLINAAGDEFFLPDNSQFYFAELPEEKHLRYVPNAQHSLAGSDAAESLQAFYEAVLAGRPRPRYQWQRQADGSLTVHTETPPRAVRLWQATNPQARDFRLDTIGPAYQSRPLEPVSAGNYVAHVFPPPQGFTAFFVELEFDSGGRYPFKFTTEVRVVPDVLPFTFQRALDNAAAGRQP